MFKIISLLLLITSIYADTIYPTYSLKSSGSVTDFVIDNGKLYASNDVGRVDIFDLKTHKLSDQILLEPILDFMGDEIMPKVFSVDRLHGKTLIVSTGKQGFSNVYIHNGKHLKNIINPKMKIMIKEARFADDEKILLGTLGDQLILYDIGESYRVYTKTIAHGAFSDMALSEDRGKIVTTDESGEVFLIDVKSSNTLKVFKKENVDNVYRVTYNNGVLITAGQDRRVGVYKKDSSYHLKSDFLVYCASLSPSATTGIYASGVDNVLQTFNVKTKHKEHRLVGHKATLTTIKFINEKELFSAAEENKILFWRLP